MNKPIIYKYDRYRHHGEAPVCRNCREKKSSGTTANGPLACVACQDKVDVFINQNFDIRDQKEYIEVLKEIQMQNDRVPGTCCPTPECANWNCTTCEYGEDCEGDHQKIDYCPRPHTCSSCGANCLECELWQKPVYFKKLFSDMTEGEALRSLGVTATERDGQKGILLPGRDGKEPIFIPASDEKADMIIASTGDDWVKGAIQVDCVGCGNKVWLSPSSQEMLKMFPEAPVYCIECFSKIAQEAER